jgi:glycosyltransferase involved in cell wall biosynthesis
LDSYPLCSFSVSRTSRLKTELDLFKLRKILDTADLVHVLVEPLAYLGYRLAQVKHCKFCLTVHGTYAVKMTSLPGAKYFTKAINNADAIFSPSQYTVERLLKSQKLENIKCHVVPWGASVFRNNKPLPSYNEREQAFLMIGEVKPRKGTIETIRALAKLRARFPDIRLYIAGLASDTDYLKNINKEIEKSGLKDNVYFLGVVSDKELQSYFDRVIGLVHPSQNVGQDFEGFGLVHLEAHANGVPSIGSLESGNEAVIKHQVNGLLVPQDKIEILTRGMESLLCDQLLWENLSKNALHSVRQYSWDNVAKSYLSVYKELLN